MPPPAVTRRTFLAEVAAASAALALAPRLAAASANPEFRSRWDPMPDRPWAGEEVWTNPMQDWRVAGGRLECFQPAPGRNVHALTRDLADRPGTLTMSVRLGRLGGGPLRDGKGAAGFSFAVRGPLDEYRNNLIFGSGIPAGLRTRGELFIGEGPRARTAQVSLGAADSVELRLSVEPAGGGHRARLAAHAPDGRLLGEVEHPDLPGPLRGNLALNANYGPAAPAGVAPKGGKAPAEAGPWWFADWRISGTKVDRHDDRAFGPVFFTQYTLHERTLKLTAQLAPVGPRDEPRVRLQTQRGGRWRDAAEARIEPLTRTALFRVANWDDRNDVPYRIAYTSRGTDRSATEHHFAGTIRRDPADQRVITVADVSCNAHYAFPNAGYADNLARTNPDLLAFTGDQYYESTGGFGVDRSGGEMSVLDVLRKWAMHGWTFRELMRDRPSIAIPDDHDVYHGNLWGEGGAAAPGQEPAAEARGGYKMTALFVNAVHRMQTAHHPDSPAKPGRQDITGYYGPLTYGRISFAVLADRQYKSAPDGKVPPTGSPRADHVKDPSFDPKTADLPGLELLGAEQLEFVRRWARDWKGADMKAAISQTLFTAMATHHGRQNEHLVADYDTNAWPQTPRNDALRELRRAFAFHLAGDQHLPAVVHYGIDTHRDGPVAFASPAVNNLYPRRFRPAGTDRTTGDFRDSFGHPLTVLACANPKDEFRPGVLEAEEDKSSGYGVVRFDKIARTITVECWPLLAEPLPGAQFPGWPVTVSQFDNYGLAPAAHLPELSVRGSARPVLEVVSEGSGELLYIVRLPASPWRPPVFAAGPYTLRLSEPETGRRREWKAVAATPGNTATLPIQL
jgi:alkaline phosphatase D